MLIVKKMTCLVSIVLLLLSTASCRVGGFRLCQEEGVLWLGMEIDQVGWQGYINKALCSQIFYSFYDTWSFKSNIAGYGSVKLGQVLVTTA